MYVAYLEAGQIGSAAVRISKVLLAQKAPMDPPLDPSLSILRGRTKIVSLI